MSEVAVNSQNCGGELSGKLNNLISVPEMKTENEIEIEEQPRQAKSPRTDNTENIAFMHSQTFKAQLVRMQTRFLIWDIHTVTCSTTTIICK